MRNVRFEVTSDSCNEADVRSQLAMSDGQRVLDRAAFAED